MPTVLKVMKVPKGSPAPPGYTFVRSIRGGDIYNIKKEVTVEDLTAMFGSSASMGGVPVFASSGQADVAISSASDDQLDALVDMFASKTQLSQPSFSLAPATFGMGRRRKTRRGGKRRKATRRH